MPDRIFTGVLDISRSRELHAAALELAQAQGDVVVDCADVSRLDTSAVQILAALRRAVSLEGRAFHIANLPPGTGDLLEATGLKAALDGGEGS